MKALIKSLIPTSIRQSMVADIYRSFRGRSREDSPQPNYSTSTSSTSVASSNTVSSSVASETSAKEESEAEMEEFEVDVRPRHLQAWIDEGKGFQVLDIREPFELQQGHLPDSIFIPMNDVPNEFHHLSARKPIVVVCAAGMRSWSVAQYLRNQGLDDVWSLENGWAAWSEHGHVSPFRGRYAVGTKVSVSAAFIDELADKPTTQYGYIHCCSRSDDGDTSYDVQFWTSDGVAIAKSIPETEVQPFVPTI